jgi:hypothetical protein
MTISSTVTDKTATANGSTTQFPFPNKIFSAADLVVLLTDLSGNTYAFTGGPTTFTNAATGLSYTVQNVDVDTGCTVVFSAAPTNGWTVDIRSAIAEVQSTSIKNQGNFLPELHEEFFDRATRMLQDLLRITYTYGIHGPDTETTPWPALPNAAGRANLALIFSGAGLPTVGTPISQTLAVSQIQFYGTDSGTANAYVVAVTSPSVAFSLTAGVLVRFTALNADTGASTLNVAGTGAQPVIGQTGAALTGGEILTTGPTWVQWTGTAWQIVGTGVEPANVRTAAEIAASVTPTYYYYPPGDVRRYGGDLTGATDSTTALQNLVYVCQQTTAGTNGVEGFIPQGTLKISSPIVFNQPYIKLRGAGMWQSVISYTASSGDVFSISGSMSSWRPTITDLCISAAATSGMAINASAVTNFLYDFCFRNLVTISGGTCFATPATSGSNLFSGILDNWIGQSTNGHTFLLDVGPSVTLTNLYASKCGTGKAGYRIAGNATLINCNGLDSGDYWCVAGQDTTASDGFQNDFPSLGNVYPGLLLIDCNVESFNLQGVELHNSFSYLEMLGGSITRSLAPAYNSMIRARYAPLVSGTPIRLKLTSVNPSGGNPTLLAGTPTSTPFAYLYADRAGVFFEDETGQFINQPGYYNAGYGQIVPVVDRNVTADVYADFAENFSAVTARRLSLQMVRYAVPAALTPVGSNQAINVTGYTRVTVTPAAAASISTATFTQTVGGGVDAARNGDLVIEAGNGNLTINYSAAAYGFRTAANATTGTYAMTAGQVARFMFSITNSCWMQV